MPFVADILRHRSVSIVGLAKNAGKTEVLNYVLRRVAGLAAEATAGQPVAGGLAADLAADLAAGLAGGVAVTSIGLDGETLDQVKRTPKPEIEIFEGMVFTTSETHYRRKRLIAEVLDIGGKGTALGRLVTARALTAGKAILSGPPDTATLRELIDGMGRFGVRTTLVDGALSRLSHGSPAVTDAMVLVTGAAVSANIAKLVRETKYVYDRTQLPAVDSALYAKLSAIDGGMWAVDAEGGVRDLEVRSALISESDEKDIFRYGARIYVPGVVSEKLLNQLKIQKHAERTELIVRDFTRIFATPETYYSYLARGGRIAVLQRSEVLSVCVNPTSPEGYRLNAEELIARMSESLSVPVYDVMRAAEKF